MIATSSKLAVVMVYAIQSVHVPHVLLTQQLQQVMGEGVLLPHLVVLLPLLNRVRHRQLHQALILIINQVVVLVLQQMSVLVEVLQLMLVGENANFMNAVKVINVSCFINVTNVLMMHLAQQRMIIVVHLLKFQLVFPFLV